MVKVERSALMPYSPEQLLAMVEDVARYPEFMPGCVAARVEPGSAPFVRAGLTFKFAGLTESFLTENQRRTATEGVQGLQMRLLRGPFKSLLGAWQFQPLGAAACKVSLSVQLEWGALSLGRLLAPQLDRAVGNVMQAFIARANAVYGQAAADV